MNVTRIYTASIPRGKDRKEVCDSEVFKYVSGKYPNGISWNISEFSMPTFWEFEFRDKRGFILDFHRSIDYLP